MPSVDSSRVKTTGTGAITYADQNSANSAADAAAADIAPDQVIVRSVQGDNIGDGEGIFAGSNGSDSVMLQFKSLQAGDGINIADDGFTITITNTANSGGGGGGGGGPSDGYHLTLGNAVTEGDGSWSGGAVALTDSTSVSNAVDKINTLLGLLVPAGPTAFPGGSLAVINTVGNNPVLALSAADHANSGISAGSSVTRIVTSSVSSNVFNDVGPGESGTITLLINNASAAAHTLNGTSDNGTYSGLVIADQKAFPVSQPGFWKSIDVSVAGAGVAPGVNKMKLSHSGAGTTNEVVFVRDDMVSTPTISPSSVTESSNGAVAFSSGVPHYGANANLLVGLSFTNLSGETYYGGTDVLTVSGTNGVLADQTFSYANLGINTPVTHQITSATAVTPVIVPVNGTTHGSGLIQGTIKNVNGASGVTSLSSSIVLVKRGAAASNKVDELSIPVAGLGSAPNNNNAIRVNIGATGDEPTGSVTSWDATATLPTYEAAVVAGILSNNQTNYLTGFLPVGPNLSTGRNGAQYATFSFQRSAVSTFKINVTGTYHGVWIKLPGVSDNGTISPNATNGWWDATKSYNGAGVPGNASDPSAGCAVGSVMAGASGAYSITFGPQTSTNSNSNTILVRIRLDAGQSITALSFSN
jgi:hypothetical protein